MLAFSDTAIKKGSWAINMLILVPSIQRKTVARDGNHCCTCFFVKGRLAYHWQVQQVQVFPNSQHSEWWEKIHLSVYETCVRVRNRSVQKRSKKLSLLLLQKSSKWVSGQLAICIQWDFLGHKEMYKFGAEEWLVWKFTNISFRVRRNLFPL